jgi:hypothetical protein
METDVGSIPIARSKTTADSVAFTPPDHWKSRIKRGILDPNWTPRRPIGPLEF